MFVSYGNFIQAVLLAVGLVWCKEMFSRLRDHVQEFREGDWSARIAFLLLWGFTVVILFYRVHFIYGIGMAIWRGLQGIR
jgi:hypothetical protein